MAGMDKVDRFSDSSVESTTYLVDKLSSGTQVASPSSSPRKRAIR